MKKDQFFWFETNKCDKDNYLSFYFHDPLDVITLNDPAKKEEFFAALEQLSKKYYLAGYFSYELGYLFEDVFQYNKKPSFPYAQFYVFKQPVIINENKNTIKGETFTKAGDFSYKIKNLKLNISEGEYLKNVSKIKDYIYKGDIFQADYTIKYKFNFSGSIKKLYYDLKEKQNAAYNVLACCGDYYIISLSPELFFSKEGERVTVKPMKGTMRRGRTLKEDRANKSFLHHDEKNRSENVMIVDLLRNDLGKISRYGSIKASKLYEIEKYNTLFQMTSVINSRLKKDISIYELIKSIYPSGSVTGAPKIRAMEILRELEKEERKVYTGAIGFFEPSGKAKFNIAIRTVLIKGNKGEMGVGGGIVYDSIPLEEFKECKLKAEFLIKPPAPEFQLIETMLFDKDLRYKPMHLKRMKESAEYFDYKFDKKDSEKQLQDKTRSLKKGRYKVRLLLDKLGRINISVEKITNFIKDYKITLSKIKPDSRNPFYFHKTTNRKLYKQELSKAGKKGFFDVIFFNEKDELTEGAITNIYMEKKGLIYTPPLKCGLLNGIIRQVMLRKGKVYEKIIKKDDLLSADAVYISNSIIGFQRVNM